MMPLNRRAFLKTSAIAAGACSFSISRAFAASDRVRLAVVGLRWKGDDLVGEFARLPQAKIVALCDVDSEILNSVAKKHLDRIGEVDRVVDYRKLLERKDVDAVVLATPNHWHALQTIWACQAGKDVYVEKPHAHSIWEGRKMIEAARKYQRVVQVGLQTRSGRDLPEAVDWIRAGNIGKIKAIHSVFYKERSSIGRNPIALKIPDSVHYDLWLGPAEDIPIYRDSLHYDWHWDWNTGNGDIANLGTHVADIARKFLGDPPPPQHVTTFGNRFLWKDAGHTPNMQVAAFDFAEAPIIVEVNNFAATPGSGSSPAFRQTRMGEVVICEGGEFRGHGGGKVYDNNGQVIKKFGGGNPHQQNFIDAVISRKAEDLNCDIAQGHASGSLTLLAGIAWRTGVPASLEEIKEKLEHNPWLMDAFERYTEQAERWGIRFDQEPWILGTGLSYDSEREIFTGAGAEQANPFLKRQNYRNNFIVPEVV